MSFTVLSEKPHQALEALAIYRYLTAKQLVQLGIAASETVARDHVLKKLKQGRYPLIGTKDFGRWPGYGRLPHVHYLTPRGVKHLAETNSIPEKDIKYPKGGVQFTRDLFHRLGTIDCYIALRRWAENNGYKVDCADLYFDKNNTTRGNSKICASQLNLGPRRIIEPDGIFILKRGDTHAPIIVEMHHGDNTARIAQQLNHHAYGIQFGALPKKYGVAVNPIILSVHQHEHIMRSVQKRLREAQGFDKFMNGFIFNTLEQVRNNFTNGWSYANLKPALIFEGK